MLAATTSPVQENQNLSNCYEHNLLSNSNSNADVSFSVLTVPWIAYREDAKTETKKEEKKKKWESVEWIPKIQDMNNYLVNAEASVAAPVNKSLSISFLVQDTYKNVPAPGKLKNDLKLIAG